MASKLQQLLEQVNLDSSGKSRLENERRPDVTPLDESLLQFVSGGMEPPTCPGSGDAYVKYWQDL